MLFTKLIIYCSYKLRVYFSIKIIHVYVRCKQHIYYILYSEKLKYTKVYNSLILPHLFPLTHSLMHTLITPGAFSLKAIPLLHCFVFASLLSAVDPVAVLVVFEGEWIQSLVTLKGFERCHGHGCNRRMSISSDIILIIINRQSEMVLPTLEY